MPYRSFADYLAAIYGQAGRAGVNGMIAYLLVILAHEPLHTIIQPAGLPEALPSRPLIEAGLAVGLIVVALLGRPIVGRLGASWGEAMAARSGRLRLAVEDARFDALERAIHRGTVVSFATVAVITEMALLFAATIGAAIVLIVPVGLGLPVLFVLLAVALAEMGEDDAEAVARDRPARREVAAPVDGRRWTR